MTASGTRTRNPLGWGYLEDRLTDAQQAPIVAAMQAFLGGEDWPAQAAPDSADVELSTARINVPDTLADVVAVDYRSRLLHAVGRSFRDLATLRANARIDAPDAVATPADSQQLADVLAWASDRGYAIVPFGGGSSVVGGVNPEGMAAWHGVVTIDLQAMNRVLEISPRDRVVHAEAGILGPALEAALKPEDLAVRHYPQS